MVDKVNMSELITEIAEQNDFYEPEIKILLQDIFIPTVLNHLQAGREVALPRLGVFYTKRSQKPTLDGNYLLVPRFRASPVAKKVINQKEESK